MLLLGSIIGVFCLGILLGPWAVITAQFSLKAIRDSKADPADHQKLMTAQIIGSIATVIWLIYYLYRFYSFAVFTNAFR